LKHPHLPATLLWQPKLDLHSPKTDQVAPSGVLQAEFLGSEMRIDWCWQEFWGFLTVRRLPFWVVT